MIVTKTPFRISFFGGGTDYPGYYRRYGGAVLATTINKYCYITLRHTPPISPHRFIVAYSETEKCDSLEQIQHPAVRECLRFAEIDRGVVIHYQGDLPARSGIGSSSSFTVGLNHALHSLRGESASKRQLAEESIHIEQECIKEIVGSQDQVSAAYGGFNHIVFSQSGSIIVQPASVSPARLRELRSHLMLFHTGIVRTASDVAESCVQCMDSRSAELETIRDLVERGLAMLANHVPIRRFGELLHEGWTAKRSLSPKVSNTAIDEMYEQAISAGAIGGKITGAGGGGFMLLFAAPERQARIVKELHHLVHVPFSFDQTGSQILCVDSNGDGAGTGNGRHSF